MRYQKKNWNPATARIARKYSQPVSQGEAGFARGIERMVRGFIDVKGPKRRTPYLRSKRSWER